MPVHEFVCADCKADVYSFDGDDDRELCHSCRTIAEMKAAGSMTPAAEAALRELLGCQIPKEEA
jgi:hypothetical protein